jgi:hypothetical protein
MNRRKNYSRIKRGRPRWWHWLVLSQQLADAKRQADYFKQQAEKWNPASPQPTSTAQAPKSAGAAPKQPARPPKGGVVDYRNPHDPNNPFAAYQMSVMKNLVQKAKAGNLSGSDQRDYQVFVDNGWTPPVGSAKPLCPKSN